MKKLPHDFSLEKYGLKVRLVNEDDAEFILSLRANPDRTKHMVTLSYDIKKQKEWIQEYKKRERDGLDYYFIYSNSENKPIGLNRISHINFIDKTAKASSFITIKGLVYQAFKISTIHSEIAFNLLNIDTLKFEVHKNNKGLIKAYKHLDHKDPGIGKDFVLYSVSKSDFIKSYNSNTTKLFLQNE